MKKAISFLCIILIFFNQFIIFTFANNTLGIPNELTLPSSMSDFEKEYINYYLNNISGREAIFSEIIGYNTECNLDDGGELLEKLLTIGENFLNGVAKDMADAGGNKKMKNFLEMNDLFRKYQKEYNESKKDDVILDFISDKITEEIITKNIKSESIKKGTEGILKLFFKEFIKSYFLAYYNNYNDLSLDKKINLLKESFKKVQNKSFINGGVDGILLWIDCIKVIIDVFGVENKKICPILDSLRGAVIDLIKLNISCADNYTKRIKDTNNSTKFIEQINYHFSYKMSLLYLLNNKYNLSLGYTTYDDNFNKLTKKNYINNEFKRHLQICIDNVEKQADNKYQFINYGKKDFINNEVSKQCGFDYILNSGKSDTLVNSQLGKVAHNIIINYSNFKQTEFKNRYNRNLNFDIKKELIIYYIISKYGGLENYPNINLKYKLQIQKSKPKNTYKTTQEKIDELRAKNTNQSIKLKQNINYSSDIGLGNKNNIEEIKSIKYYEELNNNKYYSAFYNKIKTLSTQALNNLKIENEKKINLLLAQKESNSRNNNISLLNLMNNAILSKQSELKQINNTSKEIINTDTQKSENISISVPKNDNFDLEKDVGLIYYDKNYLKLLRYNGKDYQINNIDLEKIIISGDNVLVAESDKNDLKKIKLIKNGKDYQNITVHSNILYWGKNSFDMYSDNIVYINNTSYESGFQYIGDIYLNDKKIKENGVFVSYSKGVLYYILKNGGKYELYKNHQYVDVLQNKNGNRYNDSLILDGENYAYLNNENNLIVNGKNFGEVKGIDFKSIILNGNDITYTESDYGWSCNIYMNGKKSEDKLCVRDNLNPEGYIKYSYGKDYYREFNNGYNNYYINGKNMKDNFESIDYFFGNGRDLLLVFGNKDSKSSSSPRNLMLFKNGQEIQKTVNKDIYDGGSGVGGIYFIKGGVFIKNRYGKIYYNFQEQSIDFKVSNIILNNFNF